MTIKQTLYSFVKTIVDEANTNPDFKEKLEIALGLVRVPERLHTPRRPQAQRPKGGRRASAVLDPVDVARTTPSELRPKLESLELNLLLDIVAQYGMDPGKLVMKWKSRDRVIDRIVEIAEARATKGDAFREG